MNLDDASNKVETIKNNLTSLEDLVNKPELSDDSVTKIYELILESLDLVSSIEDIRGLYSPETISKLKTNLKIVNRSMAKRTVAAQDVIIRVDPVEVELEKMIEAFSLTFDERPLDLKKCMNSYLEMMKTLDHVNDKYIEHFSEYDALVRVKEKLTQIAPELISLQVQN